MEDSELQKMAVMMAELRVDIKHLSHDVKNLTMKLDRTPSTRDHEALEERVKKLESLLMRLAWAVVAAWIGGLGVSGVLANVINKMAGL